MTDFKFCVSTFLSIISLAWQLRLISALKCQLRGDQVIIVLLIDRINRSAFRGKHCLRVYIIPRRIPLLFVSRRLWKLAGEKILIGSLLWGGCFFAWFKWILNTFDAFLTLLSIKLKLYLTVDKIQGRSFAWKQAVLLLLKELQKVFVLCGDTKDKRHIVVKFMFGLELNNANSDFLD